MHNSPQINTYLTQKQSKPWDSEQSSELYGVSDWGSDYFGISTEGNAVVKVQFVDSVVEVPLIDIVEGMKDRGLEMPAVLRIDNLLDQRIKQLNDAFASAIEQASYQNVYRGVFPIKVNQQCM